MEEVARRAYKTRGGLEVNIYPVGKLWAVRVKGSWKGPARSIHHPDLSTNLLKDLGEAQSCLDKLAGLLGWTPLPTCRVCGCTDRFGCCAGCHWVEEDLCSQCREVQKPRACKCEKIPEADFDANPELNEEWEELYRKGGFVFVGFRPHPSLKSAGSAG